MVLESMKSELSAWNDGDGIDLENWISCEGNFKLAVGYSTVFWPKFKKLDGYILLDGVSRESVKEWEKSPEITRKQVESVLNHLHIADIQHYGCEDLSLDKIIYLGNILKEIYQVKLAWCFPNSPCIVELFHSENPDDLVDYQLTFWQSKHE